MSEINIQRSEIKMLEPTEIYAEIDSRPPLTRTEAARAYAGKDVDWTLWYVFGRERSSGQVHLAFQIARQEVRMAAGTVALSDYPWLKSLRADQAVRVRGKIRHIGTLTIEVDIAELTFPSVRQTTATQV